MSHMSDAESARHRCPECGAELAAGQARCWLCARKFSEAENSNPYASPQPVGENNDYQVSLASLFLIMTLSAVGTGLFLVAPGLGVLFAVLSVPALVRTIVAAKQQWRAGAALTIGEKMGVFVVSFFIMVAIGIASSVAFGVACTGGLLLGLGIGVNDPTPAFVLGIGFGLIAAIPFAIWTLRANWPSKVEFAKKSVPGGP